MGSFCYPFSFLFLVLAKDSENIFHTGGCHVPTVGRVHYKPFDVVSIADQVFEWRFKMLTKVDEVFGVDVEALKDVGQVIWYVTFFVFSQKSSTPVDKLQVVSEVKR